MCMKNIHLTTKQYYENSSKQKKKFDKETVTIKMNKQKS